MSESLNRPCPVCGQPSAETFLRKGGFALVRCRACSMIYTNPVPSEIATGVFYDRAGGEYLSPEKLEGDYSDVRFQRELKLFRNFCPSGAVLDVGCSSGAFLYQLKKRYPNDYQICGTDISGPPLDYAAKMGVPVIRDNFLSHTFEKLYDAVTFWAVMEHLFDPRAFLRKAASILKPGGLCIILVPNMKSLAVRLLGGKYRYIYSEHLNYFTPQTLTNFVKNEFTVIKLGSMHFNPVVIYQDFRGSGREVSRAERANLLKQTTAYKKSPWMRPLKAGYQGAELILGKAFWRTTWSSLAEKMIAAKHSPE
jgi:2-polyprenyl-3-methyl-5-hydroxy-6-metoxy-1,4-benzoquinol methylase